MITIYTDGGCISNPGKEGSWSFLVLKDSRVLFSKTVTTIFSKDTTNNKMELKAFIEALKYAKRKKIRELIIFSDSNYLVNCFNKKFKINKNLDEWKIINNLQIHFTYLHVQWIKGHGENIYNNNVDVLMHISRAFITYTIK